MAGEGNTLTLRRLEAPVQKFVKVALPTDLERLQKHHNNILKFQRGQEWERLHQEHINASRTVQQLRANLREMDKLCARVRTEDARALQELVTPVRERALAAAQDFLLLHSSPAPCPRWPRPSSAAPGSLSAGRPLDQESDAPTSLLQIQLQRPESPAQQNAAESWDTLEEDLKDLSGLVTEFSLLVHSQQEKIDSIEDNVNTAAANVTEGTRSLGKVCVSMCDQSLKDIHVLYRKTRSGSLKGFSPRKAVGYKLAVLPLAGAIVGGVLGGPIGLLAGFKAAGIAAALGGGALGFAGGNLVQKKRSATLELQMKRLTAPPDQAPLNPEPTEEK